MLAIVMGSPRVKDTLSNYARNFIFSTGPSFPSLACVKASYNILESSEGEEVSTSALELEKC